MNTDSPIIEIQNLSRRYGKLDAVNGLTLNVRAGKCYGFFGRNGAGKTTTIKCLLNLLRPDSGAVRVFGLDPRKDEVAVKSRLAYVPDMVAFYPWMTMRDTLEYLASFRKHWNSDIENDLLKRFQLDPKQKASHLSKGQRTQLALIGAICPEPELLVLDEPTGGLDPIERVDMCLKIERPGRFGKLVFDDRDFDTNRKNSEAITRFFQRSATGLALDSVIATPFFAISQAQNVGLQLADFVTTIIGMRFQSNEDIKPFFVKLQRQMFEYVNNGGVRVSGLKVIRG